MSRMDAAMGALVACLILAYFSHWFLFGAFAVVLGIIGWLFAQSLGWAK